MPDGLPGLVRVVVDGGSMEELRAVLENTRAAGIKIEVMRPSIVYIDISLTLVLKRRADIRNILEIVEKSLRGWMSNLGIGNDILYSKIVDIVASADDAIWDIKDLKMVARRQDGASIESTNNLTIKNTEVGELSGIEISYEKSDKS